MKRTLGKIPSMWRSSTINKCLISVTVILVFLIGTGIGYYVIPQPKPDLQPTNIEPYLEELRECSNGGKIILPAGEYIAPSIYGENGIIRMANPYASD